MAKRKMLVGLVAMLATVGFAQDAEQADDTSSVVESAAAKVADNKKAAAKTAFYSLPLCRLAEGSVEVKLANGDWQSVEEGKFYPFGSMFRTRKNAKLTVAFGEESEARTEGEAAFGTRCQPVGMKTRAIVLECGTVDIKLPDGMAEGCFSVVAPGFAAENLAGESRYVYQKTANGDKATARCVTGAMSVSGRHFRIPGMHAADEVRITSEHDYLVTILEGTSGDYEVMLDNGIKSKTVISDDGSPKTVSEKREETVKFSTNMKINIHRAVPEIGQKMSVFVIAFDAAGNRMGDGVSFCEDRAEINSGELVTVQKTDGEDLSQRAAEAAETTADANATEDSSAEENNSDTKATETEE